MAENHREMNFSGESLNTLAGQPVRYTLTSQEARWRSLLLVRKQASTHVAEFESPATPDQQVIVVTNGSANYESFQNGRWRRIQKRPRECATIAPRNTVRSRWSFAPSEAIELISLFIPRFYFQEASEEYRRAGQATCRLPPDVCFFSDATVLHVSTSLIKAISFGYMDCYAQSAARYLATHMLAAVNQWPEDTFYRDEASDLSDKRLARVIDYLRHHYSEAVTTHEMAQLANISPFHFTRLFKRRLGCTPHRYVLRLRMENAKSLLSKTNRNINEIATACGYSNASHFAATFCECVGLNPAAYRRAHL